jgi:glutathione S-transferase
MALKLYYHPLASYCHKVLIALYENGVEFVPVIVDLGDAESTEAFRAVWPLLKFPVLVDEARGNTVGESASVIEYLDAFITPESPLVSANSEEAWQARMWDRIFDDFLQTPMQKIVGDSLRPDGQHDPRGVADAKDQLLQTYGFLENRMADHGWIVGGRFGLAECSAAPALFYADTVSPLGNAYPKLAAYFKRLKSRSSFARVLREAEPYFAMFPLERKPAIGNGV